MRNFTLGLLFLVFFVSLASAHSAQVNVYNQTMVDGSIAIKANAILQPYQNAEDFIFTIELDALEGQTNQGDLFCAFDLSAGVLDKCNGMSVNVLPFDNVNTTTNSTNVTKNTGSSGNYTGIDGDASSANNTTKSPDDDDGVDANATGLYVQYLIVINRGMYSAGNYDLEFSAWEIDKDVAKDSLIFAFSQSSNGGNDENENTAGGGGSSTSSCTTAWSCSDWSNCEDGIQTRACGKVNPDCNKFDPQPIEQQTCQESNFSTLSTGPQSTNLEESRQNFISRITGAVIGPQGGLTFTGAAIFLVLIVAASVFVRYKLISKAG